MHIANTGAELWAAACDRGDDARPKLRIDDISHPLFRPRRFSIRAKGDDAPGAELPARQQRVIAARKQLRPRRLLEIGRNGVFELGQCTRCDFAKIADVDCGSRIERILRPIGDAADSLSLVDEDLWNLIPSPAVGIATTGLGGERPQLL